MDCLQHGSRRSRCPQFLAFGKANPLHLRLAGHYTFGSYLVCRKVRFCKALHDDGFLNAMAMKNAMPIVTLLGLRDLLIDPLNTTIPFLYCWSLSRKTYVTDVQICFWRFGAAVFGHRNSWNLFAWYFYQLLNLSNYGAADFGLFLCLRRLQLTWSRGYKFFSCSTQLSKKF